MKKPTNRRFDHSGLSLFELLVVIVIIALIAAIAIPNIFGIMQNAQSSTDRRNAQNVASLSAAVLAAGGTLPASIAGTVTALTNGVTVTNGATTNGPFRIDALIETGYTNYLQPSVSGGVVYQP